MHIIYYLGYSSFQLKPTFLLHMMSSVHSLNQQDTIIQNKFSCKTTCGYFSTAICISFIIAANFFPYFSNKQNQLNILDVDRSEDRFWFQKNDMFDVIPLEWLPLVDKGMSMMGFLSLQKEEPLVEEQISVASTSTSNDDKPMLQESQGSNGLQNFIPEKRSPSRLLNLVSSEKATVSLQEKDQVEKLPSASNYEMNQVQKKRPNIEFSQEDYEVKNTIFSKDELKFLKDLGFSKEQIPVMPRIQDSESAKGYTLSQAARKSNYDLAKELALHLNDKLLPVDERYQGGIYEMNLESLLEKVLTHYLPSFEEADACSHEYKQNFDYFLLGFKYFDFMDPYFTQIVDQISTESIAEEFTASLLFGCKEFQEYDFDVEMKFFMLFEKLIEKYPPFESFIHMFDNPNLDLLLNPTFMELREKEFNVTETGANP